MDPPGTTENGLPMLLELIGNYRSSLSPLGNMVSQWAWWVKTAPSFEHCESFIFGTSYVCEGPGLDHVTDFQEIDKIETPRQEVSELTRTTKKYML